MLPPIPRRFRSFALAGLLGLSIAFITAAFGDTDIAAVYAATGNGYHRVRLPDGSFKPETYVFAEGGRWNGQITDKSIDDLSFTRIAQVISGPLREQKYIMSADPSTVELMITVFWGTTTGADDHQYTKGNDAVYQTLSALHANNPAQGYVEALAQHGPVAPAPPTGDVQGMLTQANEDELEQGLMMTRLENAQRDRNNVKNAAILGFWEDYDKAMDLPTFAFSSTILEELEADRYFVVLKAYDFQLLRTQHQKRLLWESRFSVRQRDNRFDAMLPIMAERASRWFGQNSRHLLREPVPVGHVEVGTPIVIEPPAPEAVAAPKK